jgi:excisionase family DNA binding protein
VRNGARVDERTAGLAPLLVTVEQAAELLNVGRTTMYGLVAGGTIPTVRIGKCRRVAVDALDAYVAELRKKKRR